jgi:hypothetical protein
VTIGTGILASARAIKLRLPNTAAKTHARTRAGADSTAIACHLAVERLTGNAAVHERDALI